MEQQRQKSTEQNLSLKGAWPRPARGSVEQKRIHPAPHDLPIQWLFFQNDGGSWRKGMHREKDASALLLSKHLNVTRNRSAQRKDAGGFVDRWRAVTHGCSSYFFQIDVNGFLLTVNLYVYNLSLCPLFFLCSWISIYASISANVSIPIYSSYLDIVPRYQNNFKSALLSISLSIYPSTHPSIRSSILPFFCPSIDPSPVHPSV